MDHSPPGSSVQGIFQARILEWVAISYSRWSSLLQGSNLHLLHLCFGRWILYHCATWEAQVFIYDTSIKEQIDELNFIEIKNFFSMKGTLKRMKKKRLHPHWWINSSLLSLIYMSLFEQVPKDYQTHLLRWRWKKAAAAKSLQSCPILRDPIDGSPPGSRPWDSLGKTLEWVAISFSSA